ncbi:uncharacterized protein LAJ45_10066 [Morchella importuna]|uniref:uncharacterized protein n=1 Tax=Morchella importuna TaxID=1174673 RepID=UPI001E8CB923|nr:uncharacterized protein LAJ45_10066 [Morchella importuna]KAH8145924.1 hypothetical protein LAJ45_10066 [Morchella importuna]
MTSHSSKNGSDYGGISPAPRHPVPSMQAAFEESILDLEGDAGTSASASSSSGAGYSSSSSQGSRSRQGHRHSEHHRLLKLVSQIAFGIHLLHARLAKSDPEVVRILQSHVNDMDFFVSSTTNDFEMAKSDIRQRLKHLRVPIDTGRASDVFDQMLGDREFRLEIVKGNENVEYVISRTTVAMKSALVDVREGLSAVDELAKYLLSLKKGWKNTDLIRVYTAMTVNVEQWFTGLVGLQTKGAGLKEDIGQLRRVVREIEQRTGEASRRNKDSIVVASKKSCPKISANINKPLPAPPSDSTLTAIDIRRSKRPSQTSKKPIPKRHHSRTDKRKINPTTPTIIVTEENQEFPPTAKVSRTISQRLLSRPRTRGSKDTPEKELEFQNQKRLSRIRARPVPEMWPEPLSARSGEVTENEEEQDEELNEFSFNPDKDKLQVDGKENREKKEKLSSLSRMNIGLIIRKLGL